MAGKFLTDEFLSSLLFGLPEMEEEDAIQELMQITDILAKDYLRKELLAARTGEEFIAVVNQNYEIEGEI